MIFLFFLAYWIGISFTSSLIICLTLGILVLLFLWKRFSKVHLLIGLSFLLLGIGVSFINFDRTYESYQGIVFESKDNYYLFSSHNEKYYVYEKNNDFEIGDVLEIKAEKEELSFVTLESGFNFTDYLNNKGVFYQLKVSEVTPKAKALLKPKKYRKAFLSCFDSQTSSLLNAIMFSNSSSEESISIFKDFHLSRLLSASGVYVYAYLGLVNFILSSFLKKKWSELASISFLIFYFLAVFPKFSILKIIVLTIFRWFNKYKFKTKIRYFNMLGIVGLFFLVMNKNLANQESFILGFLVSIIYYLANSIFAKQKKFKKKIFASIFVYLSLLPFEIFFYNEIKLFSFFIQFLFIPIFILLGASGLVCYYGIPIYKIPCLISNFLFKVFDRLSLFNIGIYFGHINKYFLFISYILLFIFIYYYSIKFKPLYKLAIYLELLILSICALPIQTLITEEVTFINVGQGDCCLVRRANTAVLIDTGGSNYNDIARDNLIPYFKKKRIYDIDAVIITHDDVDHCGALNGLVDSFKVKSVYRNYTSFPLNINGLVFQNYNTYIDEFSEDNEKSLVIGFNHVGKDFLIMGDAPKSIEKAIMKDNDNISCDILKVGHHGSNTSTDPSFIGYIKPEEAIISVGVNYYGHPNKEVLNTLKKQGVMIKRTDEIGSITYSNYIWM